jgi:hypothetical protein
MIDELACQLVEFIEAPNRARCFTHILNLVIKSIMHQFELPKKWRRLLPHTDDTTRNLLDLAGNIDLEEEETEAEQGDLCDVAEDGTLGHESHDSDNGWIDKWGDMLQEDIDELEESVRPIQFLLTKVSE